MYVLISFLQILIASNLILVGCTKWQSSVEKFVVIFCVVIKNEEK